MKNFMQVTMNYLYIFFIIQYNTLYCCYYYYLIYLINCLVLGLFRKKKLNTIIRCTTIIKKKKQNKISFTKTKFNEWKPHKSLAKLANRLKTKKNIYTYTQTLS